MDIPTAQGWRMLADCLSDDRNVFTQLSPNRTGGFGLYISQELTFIRRRDLEITGDGIETCWVEIMQKKEKNLENSPRKTRALIG